jgi:hypothetical protein
MKPEGAATGGLKKSIKSPAVKQVDDNHERLLKIAATAIADETNGDLGEIEEQLSVYSTEELEKLAQWSTAKDTIRLWGFADELGNTEFIRDYIHLTDFISEYGVSEMAAASYINAIQLYEEIPPQGDDGSYSWERLEQCKAALEITFLVREMITNDEIAPNSLAVDSIAGTHPYVKDENLRQLIFDPELRSAVFSIMTQRRTIRADEIEAILAEDAGALTDGVL